MGSRALIFVFVIVQAILNTHGQKSRRFFRKDYTYLSTTESFYKIHTLQKNWFEAKKRCEMEGTTLFYPENAYEAKEVISLWDRTQSQFAWVWVGITDLLAKEAFKTIDGKYPSYFSGRPVDDVYNNWAAGEPNDVGGVEDCVILRKDGHLNDDRCEKVYPFICKKKLEDLQWNWDCDMPMTDYIYEKDLGSCYKFHSDPKNWTDALKVCSAELSYLTIINSKAEANYLEELSTRSKKDNAPGLTKTGEVLVGFHNLFGDGWKTVKGQNLDDCGYSSWGYRIPDGGDDEKCGSMFFDQTDNTANNGKLNNIGCYSRAFYICEHDIASHSGNIDERFQTLLQ